MVSHLFCFGLGYTGQALARSLLAEGWRVSGTCRDQARAEELTGLGIEAHLFDRTHALSPEVLGGVTHVLNSVPPDELGDPVLDMTAAHIVAAGAEWVGYLSTTGVYGDRDGAWVDETATLDPTGDRGRRRVRTEGTWFVLWREAGVPVHIFRLAGIYGPGRSPLDQLRAGTARRIDKPGQVFSRIHVEDLVAVLKASMAKQNPGSIYNVCDDEPAAPAEVTAFGARLLGIEPPPLVAIEDAGLSEMARSFYRDNKRVRNAKIKAELGLTLRYPDYRKGLEALASEADSEAPSPSS